MASLHRRAGQDGGEKYVSLSKDGESLSDDGVGEGRDGALGGGGAAAAGAGDGSAAAGMGESAGSHPVRQPGLVWSLFFLQGVGQLFPWNAFINSVDYFTVRLCDTPYHSNFENYFSFLYTFGGIAGLLLCMSTQALLSIRLRVYASLAITVLCFALCAALTLVETASGLLVFGVTILFVTVSAVAVAFFQSGLFGLAGSYEPKYTQAMMSGQALAGLVVALAGLLTVWAGHDDTMCPGDTSTAESSAPVSRGLSSGTGCAEYSTDVGTFAYFLIAAVVLLLCVAGFVLLEGAQRQQGQQQQQQLVIQQLGGGEEGRGRARNSSDSLSGVDSDSEQGGGDRGASFLGSDDAQALLLSGDMLLRNGQTADGHEMNQVEVEGEEGEDKEREGGTLTGGEGSYRRPSLQLKPQQVHVEGGGDEAPFSLQSYVLLLRVVASPAAAVFLVYAVTLALFPAVTSKLRSAHWCEDGASRLSQDLFVLLSFVNFNLCDLLGRLLTGPGVGRVLVAGGWGRCITNCRGKATQAAGVAEIPLRPRNLLRLSAARVVFLPLFLLCNVEGSLLPLLLEHDTWPVLIMALFGLSNGYIASLSMMQGPKLLPQTASDSDKEAAGILMVFWLSLGLLAGSVVSFGVVAAAVRGS